MISLAAGQSIGAQCVTSNVITCTITGSLITSGPTNNYQVLYQGQLQATAGALYTVPTGDSALISHILLASNTVTPTLINLYINGTANGNLIQSLTIPSYGSVTFDRDGWKVYDSSGHLQMGISGDATSLQGVAIVTTAPTTGQVLEYNGTDWAPTTPASGSLDPQGGELAAALTCPVNATTAVFTTPSLAAGTWKVSFCGTCQVASISVPLVWVEAGSATATVTAGATAKSMTNGVPYNITFEALVVITVAGTLVFNAYPALYACVFEYISTALDSSYPAVTGLTGWTAIKVA